MGDEEHKMDEASEELTDEEKAIVEGDDEEGSEELKEQPDGDEEEKGETDTDTETTDDKPHKPDKDNLIPQAEFDKRVGEIRSQAEEKLDLLKRDPQE